MTIDIRKAEIYCIWTWTYTNSRINFQGYLRSLTDERLLSGSIYGNKLLKSCHKFRLYSLVKALKVDLGHLGHKQVYQWVINMKWQESLNQTRSSHWSLTSPYDIRLMYFSLLTSNGWWVEASFNFIWSRAMSGDICCSWEFRMKVRVNIINSLDKWYKAWHSSTKSHNLIQVAKITLIDKLCHILICLYKHKMMF